MRRRSVDKILAEHPCWQDARERAELLAPYDDTFTAADALRSADLSGEEAVFLAAHIAQERTCRLVACAIADDALGSNLRAGRVADARSLRAVEVARLYADGLTSYEELAVAWGAAREAEMLVACRPSRLASKADALVEALSAARSTVQISARVAVVLAAREAVALAVALAEPRNSEPAWETAWSSYRELFLLFVEEMREETEGDWVRADDVLVVERARDTLRAEVDKLRELLREVANSGVVFEDKRVGYVETQIDRVTWDEIKALEGEEARGRGGEEVTR